MAAVATGLTTGTATRCAKVERKAMLLDLLFGTSAGILTVFSISFMVLMGAGLSWMFVRKSRAVTPREAQGGEREEP